MIAAVCRPPGTGCTLAASIAAELAKGCEPLAAISNAKAYLTEALRRSANLSIGRGVQKPFNHGFRVSDWSSCISASSVDYRRVLALQPPGRCVADTTASESPPPHIAQLPSPPPCRSVVSSPRLATDTLTPLSAPPFPSPLPFPPPLDLHLMSPSIVPFFIPCLLSPVHTPPPCILPCLLLAGGPRAGEDDFRLPIAAFTW